MAKMKRKKIEFSKLLAMVVTCLFVASVIFVFYVWYREDRIGTEILGYVSTPFGVVISGYFAKAGVENYQKINKYQGDDYYGDDYNDHQ